MRKMLLVVASMALAVLLASGMVLAVTSSSEKPNGHRFEPEWMDEPVARQQAQLEAFADHWESVTPDETLYYYNPEGVYPKAVEHAARAWNALDGRFNSRGVQLVEVQSDADATVHIDGFRDCEDRDLLGYAQNREGFPDWLGVNTCALDRLDWKIRAHVLTHELGHHLGSGHQPPRLCGKSIMLEHVPCGRERVVLTKPGPRDVRWYRDRWVS
jgi:hypothetical protein